MMLEQQTARGGAPPPPVAVEPTAGSMGPPLLLTPAPTKVRFSDDPAAWARDHWPLLTAIGVVAVTAIVLSAAVSSDRSLDAFRSIRADTDI